jgi:hypothetical protein
MTDHEERELHILTVAKRALYEIPELEGDVGRALEMTREAVKKRERREKYARDENLRRATERAWALYSAGAPWNYGGPSRYGILDRAVDIDTTPDHAQTRVSTQAGGPGVDVDTAVRRLAGNDDDEPEDLTPDELRALKKLAANEDLDFDEAKYRIRTDPVRYGLPARRRRA